MAPFALIRLVALSTTLVFALAALGLAAAMSAQSGGTIPFAALGIATGVLTMITVLKMIALEILQPGGKTSMVVVETLWLSILWILWLATGALAAEGSSACADLGDELDDIGDSGLDNIVTEVCHEISALAAFAFLNWFILMGYTTMFLILSRIAASRNHTNVWTNSVANAPFSAPASTNLSVAMSYTSGTGGTTQGGTSGPIGGQPAAYNTSGSVQAGTVHV